MRAAAVNGGLHLLRRARASHLFGRVQLFPAPRPLEIVTAMKGNKLHCSPAKPRGAGPAQSGGDGRALSQSHEAAKMVPIVNSSPPGDGDGAGTFG